MKMKSKFLCVALGTLLTAGASMGQVVISQVHGGGGNSGAVYKQDFIELFNKGTTAVSIAGWSVQYASRDRHDMGGDKHRCRRRDLT